MRKKDDRLPKPFPSVNVADIAHRVRNPIVEVVEYEQPKFGPRRRDRELQQDDFEENARGDDVFLPASATAPALQPLRRVGKKKKKQRMLVADQSSIARYAYLSRLENNVGEDVRKLAKMPKSQMDNVGYKLTMTGLSVVAPAAADQRRVKLPALQPGQTASGKRANKQMQPTKQSKQPYTLPKSNRELAKKLVQPEMPLNAKKRPKQTVSAKNRTRLSRIIEKQIKMQRVIAHWSMLQPRNIQTHPGPFRYATEDARNQLQPLLDADREDSDCDTDVDADVGEFATRAERERQEVVDDGGIGVKTYEYWCTKFGCLKLRRITNNLGNDVMNLSGYSIGPLVAKALARTLESNTRVEELILNECALGREGAIALYRLTRENVFIHKLCLSRNNFIMDSVDHLVAIIVTSRNIDYLDVSKNKFSVRGCLKLLDALTQNHYLRTVSLAEVGMESPCGAAVSRLFGTRSSGIVQLDLSWNSICRNDAVAMFYGLHKNHVLAELNLERNGLGFEGALALAEALKLNKSLQRVNIAGNRIDGEGVDALADGLTVNNRLEQLVMHSNPIPVVAMDRLICAANRNKSNLIELDVHDIPINAKTSIIIDKINTNLRVFVVKHGPVLEATSTTELVAPGPRRKDPLGVIMETLQQQNIRMLDVFRSLASSSTTKGVLCVDLAKAFRKYGVQLDEGEMSQAMRQLDPSNDGAVTLSEIGRVLKDMKTAEWNRFKMINEDKKKEDQRRATILQVASAPDLAAIKQAEDKLRSVSLPGQSKGSLTKLLIPAKLSAIDEDSVDGAAGGFMSGKSRLSAKPSETGTADTSTTSRREGATKDWKAVIAKMPGLVRSGSSSSTSSAKLSSILSLK